MLEARFTGAFAAIVVGSIAFLTVQASNVQTRGHFPDTPSPGTDVASPAAFSQAIAAGPEPSPRALLNKYCVSCHNQRLLTGGLTLDDVGIDDISTHAEVWEKVLRKFGTREMPPRGRPRPDDATSRTFIASIEDALDRSASERPDPGRVPLHRLSRAEYVNAVNDLLALKVDGASLLLADDLDQHGFDNNAGVLSISPALLERYISAARTISRLAIGDPTIVSGFDTYSIAKLMLQDSRMSEELPFGSRGGLAVRHHFPLDADYVARVRLRRQLYDYIQGLGEPHQLDVRVDGALVKRFTFGGEGKGRSAPVTFAGNIQGDPEWELYMHFADAPLEVRFPVKAGDHTVGVSFVGTPFEDEGVLQPETIGFARAVDQLYYGNPAIENVMIGGPYDAAGPGDTASRRRIFSCHPQDDLAQLTCARQILEKLATRAYRRPMNPSDLQTLMEFYDEGRKRTDFEGGVQYGLERILAAPDFLFRVERDPPNVPRGTAYRLTDLELASRLSFFLWSSVPDDELLSRAVRSELKDPATLEGEVERLLADSRSRALSANFVSEWLGVRKIAGASPDPALFPEFDENLRDAFQTETELFVESQISEDRGVMELLTSNYSFINDRLGRHYGIPNVYGSHFRRVELPPERHGLLGQGSILTATSYPNRTSPVLRGHWVLENILGTPPPPPPPDVPALSESSTDAKGHVLSVRDRMQEHRKNPACAVCHVRMDPLGFALEHFDAIGRWRTSDEGAAIDSSGELPDGTRFEGVAGLQAVFERNSEAFAHTLIEKLLTYALGRNLDYRDEPAVRKITRDAAATGYRWSSIVLGIVKSIPFQMRRSES